MKKIIIPLLAVNLLMTAFGCGLQNQESINRERQNRLDKEKHNRIISSNRLGFHLLANAEADENGNLFMSPLSLWMALSMVYNGAGGVTQTEMAKVMDAEGIDMGDFNQANASLMSIFNSEAKPGWISIANSIWLNDQYHFQKSFAKDSRAFYKADLEEINMADPKNLKKINGWVNQATNGKIKQVIDNIDSSLAALIINALYFKGEWSQKFNKSLTVNNPFILANGSSKELPLMSLTGNLAYMENEDFQAVALPYTDGKRSMKIFLPKEGTDLKAFAKKLTSENWESWNNEFQEKRGTVLLPRFQVEYEAEWKEALKELGMKTAFDDRANLTKIIQEDDPLSISFIKQKTYLNVNEDGSEAAAATSVGIVANAYVGNSFKMEVKRPFFLAITDNDTGAILFMGFILNPQEGKAK
ncbi:MAG: serpin family protein [Tuberibacillus sp.]